MKHVTIKLTMEELELLISLAADQSFRREFIDPKMPGYKSNREEIGVTKALIERLRVVQKTAASNRPHTATVAG